MGRAFVAANDDYLDCDTAFVTSGPLTMVGWGEVNDNTAARTLCTVGSGGGNVITLQFRGDDVGGTDRARVDVNNVGIVSTSSYSTNTWHHLATVETDETDHTAFLDGGSKGTSTTSITYGTWAKTRIGILFTPSTHEHDGTIGPVSMWNSALTDAQIAELGAGRNPKTLSVFTS